MNIRLKPDDSVVVEKIRIGHIPALIIRSAQPAHDSPGVLWIHGGGYILGMKEMVYMSRAMDLVRDLGAVVISPGYRMAWQKPYPAAVYDCYDALRYMDAQANELSIDRSRITAGFLRHTPS